MIDLVRALSAEVRRPVRLTGPASIAMADPAANVPTGWFTDEAVELYAGASTNAKAGAAVLSVAAGDLAVSASARFARDDVRLFASGWRAPDPLPVLGFDPASVTRWTCTFTADPPHCHVEVAFRTSPVPTIARSV